MSLVVMRGPAAADPVGHGLRRLFVPSGQLSPEYAAFQVCDSVQAMCSYLRGTLCMHATLTGAGLGAADATALSSVATFMLKDGAGMVSGLLFSFLASTGFDDETRFWRLFADVINDIGLTLELAAPLFGRYFLVVTTAANVAKSLCGVAAGATRTAVSAHFALSGNVAEVQAKEGVQETFVTLLGMLSGYFLVSSLAGSGGTVSNQGAAWAAFALLTGVHVIANWIGMRLLALRSLNRSRSLLLRRTATLTAGGTRVLTPVEARSLDPLLMPLPYAGALYRALQSVSCVRTAAHRTPTAAAWCEPCDFASGVAMADVQATAEESARARGFKAADWRRCILVLRREASGAWAAEPLESHLRASAVSRDKSAPSASAAKRRRGSTHAAAAAVAASVAAPTASSAGNEDAVLIAWSPAAPHAAASSLRLPCVLTGERVAPVVRVACMAGATSGTLFAAYLVATTLLCEPAAGTLDTALSQEACAEAAVADAVLEAAERAGWESAAVRLGDGGYRYSVC